MKQWNGKKVSLTALKIVRAYVGFFSILIALILFISAIGDKGVGVIVQIIIGLIVLGQGLFVVMKFHKAIKALEEERREHPEEWQNEEDAKKITLPNDISANVSSNMASPFTENGFDPSKLDNEVQQETNGDDQDYLNQIITQINDKK